MARREKQSEVLEIRLGHAAKQAFMEACRGKNMTASEVVRAFVEHYPDRSRPRTWARFPPQLTEFPMTMTLSALLAASLAASSMLPSQMATADYNDPEASFTALDGDGDGYFTLIDLYHEAGLTDDGRLGADLRATAMESIQSALAEYGPAVQQELLSPDYIERVMADADLSARESVSEAFDEIDTDADGRISRVEFLAAAD